MKVNVDLFEICNALDILTPPSAPPLQFDGRLTTTQRGGERAEVEIWRARIRYRI